MGYFSNGTEGRDYHEKYCRRCYFDVHENCPIWVIHLLHNGENNPILDEFIPLDEKGNNLQCRHFTSLDSKARPAILE